MLPYIFPSEAQSSGRWNFWQRSEHNHYNAATEQVFWSSSRWYSFFDHAFWIL